MPICRWFVEVEFVRQMAFRLKINYRFRKCTRFPIGVFCLISKLFCSFGRFRFGWDFPTVAVLGDFEPPKLIVTHRIRKRHILTPNHVFEPSYIKIRCELWSVGNLTKQEASIFFLNREFGILYFTHMGSRSRRTDHYEMWQFFSSYWRNHSFKMW